MREAKLETSLGPSTPPVTAVAIDCAQEVIEQIRAAALAGRRQLARGGLEVGGLLLGERSADAVRILSWRPILCEHARGPAFLLTDKDRADLANLLLTLSGESSSTGSHPLGWFVSHTKSAAAMTDSDLEIYQKFFPEPWQIMLVLNPGRDGTVQASFYTRHSDGQIRLSSQLVFSTSAAKPAAPTARHPVAPEQDLDSRGAVARRPLWSRRGWVWLVPALLALIVLGIIVGADVGWPTGGSKPASFGFRASDVGGVLRLEWDRNSEAIRQGARATVDIKDGNVAVPIALDAYRLREGFADYTRQSGDLELRMTVYPANGAPVQEFTRFVGDPTPQRISPAEAVALRTEVQQLRERNQQLEQTIRNLGQRGQAKKPRSRRRR